MNGSGTNRWLLEAAQQGDRAAQDELLRRYEPLVQRVVRNLGRPRGYEREDLAQEARIGLASAIRAWRPERGPFSAFAVRCVRNQALHAVRAAGAHKHQILSRAISLETPHGGYVTDRGQPGVAVLDKLSVHDPRSDPEARLLISEQLISLRGALPTLTASERRALAGALADQSYQRLAPVLRLTPRATRHAVERARRKLAAALPSAA
jgi:RNA polymerase sporulation-specific sigma factor